MRDLGEIFSSIANACMCWRRILSHVFAYRKDNSVKDFLRALCRSSTKIYALSLGEEPIVNDSKLVEFLDEMELFPK